MEPIRLSPPLLVRHARLEDARLLQRACFPEQPYEWVHDYLNWCLQEQGRPLRLVAFVTGGRLIGHVELAPRQSGHWAELSSLVISAPWRRRDLGRRLVGATARQARRWGCDELRLQVEADAYALIDHYQLWGFEPRGAPLGGRRWFRYLLGQTTAAIDQSYSRV